MSKFILSKAYKTFGMKGQASMEFVMVVGMALILSSPFILEAQSSVIEVSYGSDVGEFQSSLDRLERAVQRVNSMGEPAREVVSLEMPNNIEQAYISNDRGVVFTEDRGGQQSNYTRIFEVSLNDDGLPTEEGTRDVEVEAWNGEVNLSYQE